VRIVLATLVLPAFAPLAGAATAWTDDPVPGSTASILARELGSAR
jgi:hypothetical protein